MTKTQAPEIKKLNVFALDIVCDLYFDIWNLYS
jgi:hypothetical protein